MQCKRRGSNVFAFTYRFFFTWKERAGEACAGVGMKK